MTKIHIPIVHMGLYEVCQPDTPIVHMGLYEVCQPDTPIVHMGLYELCQLHNIHCAHGSI